MGTTTFSGPVKAGTVREGASANTGSVLMAQSAVIDIIGATNTTAVGIIPANFSIYLTVFFLLISCSCSPQNMK